MIKKTIAALSLVPMISWGASDLGYIIKLKPNALLSEKSFSDLGEIKNLNLKSGNFFKFNPNQNFKSNDLDFLKENPAIEYIEKNVEYKTQVLPADPILNKGNRILSESDISDRRYAEQWGLENDGWNSRRFVFFQGLKGEDVKAKQAWEIEKGSKDITIAVIDTGVNYKHDDLKENLWINEKELNGKEGIDDDGNGYIDDVYGYDFFNNDSDPMDGNGHGTHCAGVIAASHNDIGIRGLMAEAKIMSVQFLSSRGSGTTEGAIKAIDYAINNGADILSNSWGGGPYSQALFDVLKKAEEKGVVVVAAAGNSNSDLDRYKTYPASYEIDNIIAVAASEGRGNKAGFSSYGKKSVEVFAPGWSILSTYLNNGYKFLSGTSMATPMVSGIIGLSMSHQRTLSAEEIKSRLLESTDKRRSISNYTISGRVNAFKMLDL